jgi:hypothetical protein
VALKTLAALAARISQRSDAEIHFHQGPQGQPTPCFEHGCDNPRLDA